MKLIAIAAITALGMLLSGFGLGCIGMMRMASMSSMPSMHMCDLRLFLLPSLREFLDDRHELLDLLTKLIVLLSGVILGKG